MFFLVISSPPPLTRKNCVLDPSLIRLPWTYDGYSDEDPDLTKRVHKKLQNFKRYFFQNHFINNYRLKYIFK